VVKVSADIRVGRTEPPGTFFSPRVSKWEDSPSRMPARAARVLVLLLSLVAVTGAWNVRPAANLQESSLRAVGAVVDSPFALKLQGSAKQRVTLGPMPNGLQVAGGRITGTPARAMIMHAVAATSSGIPDTTWIVVFASALEEPALPREPYRYRGASQDIPAHLSTGFRFAVESPEVLAARANPTTDAGAALGRVLFYDRRLSANDAVSCSSCHLQFAGFGDTARLSRGHKGRETRRHSMALANVRFIATGGFFWDQRAKTLEQQVLMPIQDSIEMGMSLPDLQRKLNLISYYPALYDAAFGSPEITIERTARALAQFLRTLVSADSPFDRAFSTPNVAPDLSNLTPLQQAGSLVFRRSGCTVCHVSSSQIVVSAMNSGLDAEPADTGAGRGMFRAPSLRNVAVRAPYMHDGRFKTLDEVIDFYSSGVQANPHLDLRLRNRATQEPRRLDLSAEDRAALKAFLHTLTDSTFLSAPEFSDPFRRRD
jgi:cytochrome c peroxidase